MTDEKARRSTRRGSDESVRIGGARTKRLLDEDVTASFERASSGIGVGLDRGRDDDEVGRGDARAFVIKRGDPPRARDFLGDGSVGVEDAGELEVVGESTNDARVKPSHRAHAEDSHATRAALKRSIERESGHSERESLPAFL
jgi:hypothetical protein